ncbi:MAG: sulfate ABC transporter permease [Kouleothrix sp.]|jgi:sulfate transport system permease protein|nr:sulfate ABC transporter permease [Kouleothrix sp.]
MSESADQNQAPQTAHQLGQGGSRAGAGWLKWLLIGLVVAYIAVIIVVPLGALVLGAFAGGPGAIIAALSEPDVYSSFWRTLLIALIVVAVHGTCGTAAAWVLVRQRFLGRRILNGLIDLPFAVSPVIAGYMLILLFGRRGVLGPLTQAIGVPVAFALPGMILATLFVTLPFMVRELMPVLQAFGTEQEQAAATIGASGWQTFRHVTFPALRWGFIYGITLTFARALGEFGAVLVISGGVQGRTETATLYIFRALDDRQYVGAYSAALVLGLVSLLLVLAAERLRGKEQ